MTIVLVLALLPWGRCEPLVCNMCHVLQIIRVCLTVFRVCLISRVVSATAPEIRAVDEMVLLQRSDSLPNYGFGSWFLP